LGILMRRCNLCSTNTGMNARGTKICFLIWVLIGLSFNGFSQKLKTYEDSVKYDKKMAEFEKIFVSANLEKNRQNYDQAQLLYFDCLKIKPSSAAVYYELAQVCTAKNNFTEAEEYAKKAVKFSPDNFEYKRFLDDLYVKMGKKR